MEETDWHTDREYPIVYTQSNDKHKYFTYTTWFLFQPTNKVILHPLLSNDYSLLKERHEEMFTFQSNNNHATKRRKEIFLDLLKWAITFLARKAWLGFRKVSLENKGSKSSKQEIQVLKIQALERMKNWKKRTIRTFIRQLQKWMISQMVSLSKNSFRTISWRKVFTFVWSRIRHQSLSWGRSIQSISLFSSWFCDGLMKIFPFIISWDILSVSERKESEGKKMKWIFFFFLMVWKWGEYGFGNESRKEEWMKGRVKSGSRKCMSTDSVLVIHIQLFPFLSFECIPLGTESISISLFLTFLFLHLMSLLPFSCLSF